MSTLKNIKAFLSTRCSESQMEFLQPQLDFIRDNSTPYRNIKLLCFQLIAALFSNFFQAYIFYTCTQQLSFHFDSSPIDTIWLLLLSSLQISLIIPKLILVFLIQQAFRHSFTLTRLLENFKIIMSCKVYYYNSYQSRFIWITYIVGGALMFYHWWNPIVQDVIESNNNLDDDNSENQSILNIWQLCDYSIYFLVVRLCLFGIYLCTEQSDQPMSRYMIDKKAKYISEKEAEAYDNACSICIEQIKGNQLVLKLICGHIFHDKCLIPWVENSNKCPNCNSLAFDEI